MKLMVRLVTAGVGALALMLVFGVVTPAEAANKSVYVGAPGNGCPANGTYFADIQSAVNAMPQPKKVTVCAGFYDSFEVVGKSNMKLMTKGLVVVLPATPDFNGPVIYVHNSANITIRGFVVDSNGAFESGTTGSGGYGIWYDESSGTISKNTVLRIAESPIDDYSLVPFTGILVSGTQGQPVTVKSNTVKDYEWIGINVVGNVKAEITKNRVEGDSWLPSSCPCAADAPSAIVIENNSSTKVTRNILKSNFVLPLNSTFGLNFSYGVVLYESSGILVNNNKINNFGMAVNVLDDGISGAGANRNTISNNTITNSFLGIFIVSNDEAGISLADPHTDLNRVKGNKLVSNDFFVAAGIVIELVDDPGDDPIHAFSNSNAIIGNKMYNYQLSTPIDIGPGVFGTVQTGNKTDFLAKPGAAPGPQIDFSSRPTPFLSSRH